MVETLTTTTFFFNFLTSIFQRPDCLLRKTPAAETGTVVGDGGAEGIGSGSDGDSGGAAEEMDQEGSGGGGLSGRAYPAGWATKTRAQMH